ncbi:hypothetical protein [Luteibacter aegosomatissinici]|uniref:hypothetical protein n=1 Tax=Luteibacter aegosomatissinici TaxID=2911539 RepID=UPI001FFAB981|nr:hypothetical protein [Luteibacter aegosomatissinici]UPG94938.1 hypothetical protein L2Y97_02185 [Luteibacter aegosomatissinici]
MRNTGACAIAATLLTMLATAPASSFASSRVGPPAGDILSAWVRQRLTDVPAHDQLVADNAVTRDMVTLPDSIYTWVRNQPLGFRGSVWTRAFSSLATNGTPMTRAEATQAIAWDLGMTNGYPGIVDPVFPVPVMGDAWAGTQLAKAGVTEEIARKALALTGHGASAVAANYAVAVQILVDKLACFDATQWPALGLRKDVLERFMLATSAADLRNYDLVYLVRLLQGELSTWHAGEIASSGRRELPTMLRVARVAAAFRDMQGYVADPCNVDGSARLGVAATHPDDATNAMCMVAATDRAVLRWYLQSLDRQTDPVRVNFVTAVALRMSRFLRPMRPLWLGVLGKDLQSYGSHVEVTEALVASQLVDDESTESRAERYNERLAIFLCDKDIEG